jgi:hypothetical protein
VRKATLARGAAFLDLSHLALRTSATLQVVLFILVERVLETIAPVLCCPIVQLARQSRRIIQIVE